MDAFVFVFGSNAEGVVADVVLDEVTDAIGIAGGRKAGGEEGFEGDFELVENGAGLSESGALAEGKHFLKGHGTGVGGIAKFFHMVISGALSFGRSDVNENDAAAGLGHTGHFGEHNFWLQKMMKCVTAERAGERSIGKGQCTHVADVPGKVG